MKLYGGVNVFIVLWHAVWKAELKYPLPDNGYELRIRGYNYPRNRNNWGIVKT
jgi:hypothetical protein